MLVPIGSHVLPLSEEIKTPEPEKPKGEIKQPSNNPDQKQKDLNKENPKDIELQFGS